ncbi:TetR/AcrR family transcriptional regulator [Subtercola endophyticus]|uniref:TetR/AcrR family transcriptional regulator n=1 Tax=Subtercola endophyticus TaxID=2895559 RepID=UPI001E5E5653|nr:TetR/AcrR family transcriptional regulator [Subtercola endophyticus]UFS60617.1 TetR/AcrR family transcriptional regulator [Subtercola endophyticus]
MEKVGRKRSEEARAAVLRAMRELVTEQGYSHVTIEKIAARARVGKPTIYRWWQSKNAILAECVLSGEVLPTPVEPTSPTGRADDAAEWLHAVLAYIDDNAPLLRGIVAAAFEDVAVAEQLSIHLAYPIEAVLQQWASIPGGDSTAAELSPRALAQLFMGGIVYRLSRTPGVVVAGDDPMEELFDMLVSRMRTANS